MMTPKQYERACNMFNTLVTKYADELSEAHFDTKIIEIYDGRYGEVIQTPFPWVSMYWR